MWGKNFLQTNHLQLALKNVLMSRGMSRVLISYIYTECIELSLILNLKLIIFLVICFLYPVIGRLTIVARNLIRYVFPALYCYGTLFIDNNNKAEAVEKLSKQSVAIRNDSAKLILFPEGKRNQGEQLLPFKKGPFHTAVQSQSSVQPVVVSRYDFLDANRKIFNSGKLQAG